MSEKKKVYNFTVHNPETGIQDYSKTEDILDQRELDLLLGELMNRYSEYPKLVRMKFTAYIQAINMVDNE